MDINLLPTTTKSRPLRMGIRFPFTGFLSLIAVVIVIAAAGVYAGWLRNQTNNLRANIATLSQQVQASPTIVKAQSPQTDVSKVAQALGTTTASRTNWTDIVKNIDSALAPGMTVDILQTSGDTISVEGRSTGIGPVAQFEHKLSVEPWSASVSLQSAMQATGQQEAVFTHGSGKGMSYTYSLHITTQKAGGGGGTP